MFDKPLVKCNDYASTYGSLVLKSLQNDNMPDLDLLVREAVQNSSDAALQTENSSYNVSFNTGLFRTRSLNSYMTDIQDILNRKYASPNASFLEIRDTKTAGLTGPVHLKDINRTDDHGNYFKLIFDTGKMQLEEGAGGNWGFGKSVYYRVGIGLVIFYSRIAVNDGYESRLIVSMIENETRDDAVLAELDDKSTGRAWWGLRDKKDYNEVLPVTDEKEIEQFLSLFKLTSLDDQIHPFIKKQTGTSIIIPYIDTAALLAPIIPVGTEDIISEEIRQRCVWANKLEDYITLALEKWYAPKIENKFLEKLPAGEKWLRARVNGKGIKLKDMPRFFQLVQALYNHALAKCCNSTLPEDGWSHIVPQKVRIKNILDNTTAGYVASIQISREELLGPNNELDPYSLTRNFDKSSVKPNEPIVMFAREPGMVISYQIASEWTKGISNPSATDEYIFGFFVPNATNRLKPDLPEPKYASEKLGEYLRNCETSDHTNWNDKASINLVGRIKTNTARLIQKTITDTIEQLDGASTSRLSNYLGKILMPPVGYAGSPAGKGGRGSGGGSRGGSGTSFKITSTRFIENELVVEFAMKFKYSAEPKTLRLEILSEGGTIDAKAWEKDIRTVFPIAYSSVHLIASMPKHKTLELTFSEHHPMKECDYLQAKLWADDDTGRRFTSLLLNPVAPGLSVTGEIHLKTTDKKYECGIKAI